MSLTALLKSAAFAPISNLGWIKVTGSDRTRWLNGMVTNNIKDLAPGHGCYAFVLSNQGRIQADLTAYMLEDSILLETAADRVPSLIALLDRFIIMDDVELTPLLTPPDDLAGILIAGPHALAIVQNLGNPGQPAEPCTPSAAPTPNLKQTTYAGASVNLIHAHSPLVPRFEIWSNPATIALILDELKTTEAVPTTEEALDQLRLLEGTPLYGTDIRDKELPQETAQTRALHFAKGCYLGQEIVERIHSRGNVHRTLSGFLLTGPIPAPRTQLVSEAKTVGEITSAAEIHLRTGTIQLALGYIRREALDRAAPLEYPGGIAVPIPIPHATQD